MSKSDLLCGSGSTPSSISSSINVSSELDLRISEFYPSLYLSNVPGVESTLISYLTLGDM